MRRVLARGPLEPEGGPRAGAGRGRGLARAGRGRGAGGRASRAEWQRLRRPQFCQAMPATRVEYIAPWWVVWLHSVPHLGLRLQPVDSTFKPRDERYQEVSPRGPGPGPRPAPLVPAPPVPLPRRRSLAPLRPPTLLRGLFTPLPFHPGPWAHGPPVQESHGPGKLGRWELGRRWERGGGTEAACRGGRSAEGEGGGGCLCQYPGNSRARAAGRGREGVSLGIFLLRFQTRQIRKPGRSLPGSVRPERSSDRA